MTRWTRAALVVAIAWPAAPLAAQVGFPPDASPYRDIRATQAFSLYGGYIGGGRGKIGLGPAGGPLGGVRYELSIGGPTDMVFGLGYGQLKRYVIDPKAPDSTRTTGPVNQSLYAGDIGLNILLTGRKTWHLLAPYVGATLGLTFGGAVPSDSSGYNFNAKFTVGPQLGIRWYPSQDISVRFEGRYLFWQVKYPSAFFVTPARAPNQPSVLDPTTDPTGEWLAHPTLVISVGYAFRR